MDWLDLVLRSAEGDIAAFESLVRRFQNRAVGYAFSLLGDFQLAEDAAQEAFIEAYRDLGRLRIPKAFPSWLRKIIHKRCDRLKRKKHFALVSLDGASEVLCDTPNPEEAALRNETHDLVHNAILSLSEKERAVTTLFYIDEHPMAEIRDFLGIPVNTIKKRLFCAREKLREKMMAMVEKEMKQNAPNDAFSAQVIRNLFVMEIGADLVPLYNPKPDEGILECLRTLRRKLAHDFGCFMPLCQISDSWAIGPRKYRFIIKGMEVESGEVFPGYLMVEGLPVSLKSADVIQGSNPVTGLPVFWINKDSLQPSDIRKFQARKPEEVIVDHLAAAVQKHAPDLLVHLLPPGKDPNSMDEDGLTPLSIAAGCGNPDLVEFLLAKGATTLTLHSAVFLGNLVEVKKILAENPETNPKVNHPRIMPPLVLAATRGHKEIASFLVKKGADVNVRFTDGCTPLHAAIAYGHTPVCRFLLTNGADPHLQNHLGVNSLHLSVLCHQKKIAEMLLEKGMNINIANNAGRTPLQIAENLGYQDIARILKKAVSRPNS